MPVCVTPSVVCVVSLLSALLTGFLFGLCVCDKGGHVAVGTHKGSVQIWDASLSKKISTLDGHSARVGQFRVLLLLLLVMVICSNSLAAEVQNGIVKL